jgi:hypothetical protein
MTPHKTPKVEVLLALHGAREAIAGMAAARLDAEPAFAEALADIAEMITEAGTILEKSMQTKGDQS